LVYTIYLIIANLPQKPLVLALT